MTVRGLPTSCLSPSFPSPGSREPSCGSAATRLSPEVLAGPRYGGSNPQLHAVQTASRIHAGVSHASSPLFPRISAARGRAQRHGLSGLLESRTPWMVHARNRHYIHVLCTRTAWRSSGELAYHRQAFEVPYPCTALYVHRGADPSLSCLPGTSQRLTFERRRRVHSVAGMTSIMISYMVQQCADTDRTSM